MDAEVRPFRWSFSQWETYDQCPAKWKYKSILRLPTLPPGPAAARGLDMHDRMDKYITGQIELPYAQNGDPNARFGSKKAARVHDKYIPIIDAYRNHPNGSRHSEKKLGFDREWYLCDPKSRFAWCIAVLDGVRCETGGPLRIGEWKSGTPKARHQDQRSLYAIFGMKAWLCDDVEVTTYYLELPDEKPQRLIVSGQAGFEKLKSKWTSRAEQMENDAICAPRPNEGCQWCDFARGRGGPCQFG